MAWTLVSACVHVNKIMEYGMMMTVLIVDGKVKLVRLPLAGAYEEVDELKSGAPLP